MSSSILSWSDVHLMLSNDPSAVTLPVRQPLARIKVVTGIHKSQNGTTTFSKNKMIAT